MANLTKKQIDLLGKAQKAMQNAHVLWGFKVGAAILTDDGNVYEGCNVESWVSGLGICAERLAIDHAVVHGSRKIVEIAIVINAVNKGVPRPCGACLQHIHDFAEKPQIKIIMAKAEADTVLFNTIQVKTLEELLPFPFKM